MRARTSFVMIALGATFFVATACGSDDDPNPDNKAGAQGGDSGVGGAGGAAVGGPVTPDYEVELCADAPAAPTDGSVCTVQAGDERVAIVGDILQPGKVLQGGAVVLDKDGRISCVGCDCLADAKGATQVLCGDAVVSPGLIDAHDHIGWMNGKPWVASEKNVDPALRWEHRNDWRKAKREQPKISVSGGGASKDEKVFGELRFVLGGATAKFGSGDLGGLLRDLDSTGSGDNGLGQPGAKYDTFPLGDSKGGQFEEGCTGYKVPNPAGGSFDCHAPHVAEGIDKVARNEFHCLTGQGEGAKEVLDGRSALIHGIGVSASEVGLMATTGMRLIWSPRSNLSLYGNTAPITLYDSMGVSIGLGTDWIPSGSMNMLRELACASDFNDNHLGGYFSDHKLWQMATIGSARALAFDDATGQLVAGHAGDIAVFANADQSHYGAVVRGKVENVALVLRGGKVLSGNTDIVSALAKNCESLDVCGVAKQVCVERDTGVTLAKLQQSNPAYPLFFCGTPDDEPTCLPSRTRDDDSVNGSSNYSGASTADDKDGDGIDDASDNCSEIFNPIRPLDDGKQGDTDGDGVGDVCDPCPLNADTDNCTASDPNDRDGDGVTNVDDNCPGDANKDQADADGDDKGDVCDACPDKPNPGNEACPGIPTSIMALQDASNPSHPAVGARVQIKCVMTAVGPSHSWCQDAAGGPYSGITIYERNGATYQDGSAVMVGDEVIINGDYSETYDVTQLGAPTFEFVAKATVPDPITVAASDLATGSALAEQYEGVLVRVADVSVLVVNADDPNDYDEFSVTGGLRIDDLAIDGGGTGGLLDNTYALNTAFSAIVGVHHFSFNHFKLLPRTVADLVLAPAAQ